MSALLLALALAAPSRIAVLPLAAPDGIPERTAAALSEAVTAETRRASGADVITQREIQSVLTLEKQKEMLGCTSESCMAELGGALGADRLVTGDVSKVGESLLVHLRLVDVTKVRVTAQSDRRLKGGTLDDLLDVLPAMVRELFGAPPPAAVAAVPAPAGAAAPAPGPTSAPPKALPPVPPPWVEEPDAALKPGERAKLVIWTDGNGNLVATIPFVTDAPLYAGSGRKLHRVRVIGELRDEARHERTFWDPRARRPAEASLEIKGGGAVLTCGDREVPLRRLPPRLAGAVLGRGQLLAARWRRYPHFLARDEQGTYYYVDGARGADGRPAAKPDYRLYSGRKGAMARLQLEDSVLDRMGATFVGADGRLVFSREEEGRRLKAEWVSGSARTALVALDPPTEGPLIYGELGVYAGEPLGTPCDGRL